MTLTQSGVQSALSAAFSNSNTPEEVKSAIDNVFNKFPHLGGITPAQEAAKVESFLSSDVTTWTVSKLQKVIVWLRDHWEDIPS